MFPIKEKKEEHFSKKSGKNKTREMYYYEPENMEDDEIINKIVPDNSSNERMKFFLKSEHLEHIYDESEPYLYSSKTKHEYDTKLGVNFINKYKPWKWTFNVNYREGHKDFYGEQKYYADDASISQYINISRKKGFLGILPKIIKRKDVVHDATVQALWEYGDHNKFINYETLTEKFLGTQNGKSTQRILDRVGLKVARVIKIEREGPDADDETASLNIWIKTEPKV